MTILIFINILSMHTVFVEGHPVVFLALEHNGGIILLDLNNGNIESIITGVYNPAIDYHSKQGLLFYTDRTARTISRIRYPSNGNPGTSEIIISARENHRPIDIAVDSINNYIYWADDFADSITRADLCGLNQNVILQDNSIQEIRGITLDIGNSAIYFTDKSAGKIEKINLDGSNRQTLYSIANSPNLIDLDITGQRLYWTNEGSQNIQSMTTGGNDIKTVVSYSHYPYGIQIYKDLIYWTQTRNGIVKKVDKTGGSYSSWFYTRPYNSLALKVYGT
ncbi:LRP5_6 [Mytilus coruscus]|uniref:LRP5_6 n=1 Tax=Mytilus coruscus TaxID=42192 RepID=A0A6J8APL6_MYTCO|nr:LRP5_6 [Mytilus coruscus]